MATLTVGFGEQFSTIAAAVAASLDGDVVEVAAGTYTNDFLEITTRITIEGVGGMVHIVATDPPSNGKAVLTTDTDVTLINIELSGAVVSDGNGAGIRYQGGNLTLDHVFIHDNQDGLLGAADPTGSITIKNSEFSNNGSGTGATHNIYVGAIDTFSITDSYIHDAVVGHEIKSRAANNIIKNDRIANGPNGTASYEIDLPNGGNATIQNNVIKKGPNAQNPFFISYGEEGNTYGTATVSVASNTILNDARASTFFHDFIGENNITITGNNTFGLTSNQLYSGSGVPTISNNTPLATEPAVDTSSPWNPPVPFSFPCFAAGTHVLTNMGEVAVERLKIGDRVMTVRDHKYRPIKWIGHRRINLTAHPVSRVVRPVRVTKGAISDNVPHRDLLLSPDHAVHTDGVLIGVRQLINGMSIYQDTTITTADYYHVELDSHDILLSEGLTTESYLDTGNSRVFDNSEAPMILHPNLGEAGQLRFARSCATFHADEATVKPIWQRFADRAKLLGYTDNTTTTTIPDFRLLAGDQSIVAVRVVNRCHMFVIPDNIDEVRLLSRAASPTECRPWLDDNRQLGISIAWIGFHTIDKLVKLPMDHPCLSEGWWAAEVQGDSLLRWTNGNALIRLPPNVIGSTVLEVQLAGEMIYPIAKIDGVVDADLARRM
jgi:hypothetical protein